VVVGEVVGGIGSCDICVWNNVMRLGIGEKLVPSFFVLVLVVAGIGALGGLFSLEVLSDVDRLLLGQSREAKAATDIRYEVDALSASIETLLSQGQKPTGEDGRSLVKTIKGSVERVRERDLHMAGRLRFDIEVSSGEQEMHELARLCEGLKAEMSVLGPLVDEMLVMVGSDGVGAAEQFFGEKGEPVLAKVRDISDELEIRTRQQVLAEGAALRKRVKSCAWIGLIMAAVGVTGLMAMRYSVKRAVLYPARELVRAAEEIRGGNLETVIRAEFKNEIGVLAEHVGYMAQELKACRKAEGGNKLNKAWPALSKGSRVEGVSVQVEADADKAGGRTRLCSQPGVVNEDKAGESGAQERLECRIKQLKCFYGLSKLVERPQISLEQIFQESTELIRSAYKEPELTCVRISFDGVQYKTENFEKSELSQCALIKLGAEQEGAVEVYYQGEKGEAGESPFAKEEREMLDAVAEDLGRVADGKRAREKLQLFRNLIDRSNDCIFVIDSQWGRLLDVNDRACESLGYGRQELLEMSVKDIDEVVGEDSCWERHVQELREKGDIVIEGEHRCNDGSRFAAETSFRLVSHRKGEFIIAITRDITDRKRAEENQAKLIRELKAINQKVKNINQELTDFAYIVSHDLKAPLRGIKTLADWISTDYADSLDENGKERLKLLLGRVERMHNLIAGVLQYSRVGRVKEKKVRVDLNELVAEVIDMVAPPENIEVEVDDSLPVMECEKTGMIQVFENLLSNAIKYMDKAEGQIRVGCVEEDGFWKFSVSDNGPGIEAKYFDKIFRIFQTLAPRDEFESTGVGLTVVKKIVSLNGGKTWVESEPGRGSTFLFTLPRLTREVKNAELKADIAC
jgi:PAS domain S-box-containing protein